MDLSLEWPEPIVSVQSLSESGAATIPERYVKPPPQRPAAEVIVEGGSNSIPVIDIAGLVGGSEERRATMLAVSDACRGWGFFQVVNHGVSSDLVERMRKAWKEFFALPMEEKKKLANDPNTYEGYGSRVGVDKDTSLDWSDYYYLRVLPETARNYEKWPMFPNYCMETLGEYSREMEKLCERLLEVLSTRLGFDEDRFLKRAFGGEGCGAGVRVGYYPKCPRPDLALGMSPHSDVGILTVLLSDERVRGLQVRKGEAWFTIDPVPNAFVINVADQMQVISNGIYKSVEHRVTVNTEEERLSVAFFYGPDSEVVIGPAEELVTPGSPALYPHTTFKEYRLYLTKKGLRGKSQLESLKVAN